MEFLSQIIEVTAIIVFLVQLIRFSKTNSAKDGIWALIILVCLLSRL